LGFSIVHYLHQLDDVYAMYLWEYFLRNKFVIKTF